MLQASTITFAAVLRSQPEQGGLSAVEHAYLLYKATTPSGKVYVGVTSKTLGGRRRTHFSAARSKRGWGNRFRHALKKYGTAVQWDVLEDGIQGHAQALERETYWIAFFQADDPLHGYNSNKGGGGPSRTVADLLQAANANPVLRSDGRPFISAREASKKMGLAEDMVAKAVRGNRLCCGFHFLRISYEGYVEANVAWRANHGRTVSESRYVKQRGWKWSVEQREKLMTTRGRPRSFAHEQTRLAAISKKVFCSDGRQFASLCEAAVTLGVTVNQASYACRRGRILGSCLLSDSPISVGTVEAARDRRTSRKSVRRSDGSFFKTMSEAARELGVAPATMTYAIRHGSSVKGFKFSQVREGN